MINTPSQPAERRKRAAGAFFGRRKAKPLKALQAELLHTRLPHLQIDLTQTAPQNSGELFTHNPAEVILEIGFGGGEHLVQRAGENPTHGYIGVEPFLNGMGKILASIENEKLTNIRLFDEDATLLLDWLPDDSINLIYLLYPDPWHKKRHWKRRFVNDDNLNRFARILKPQGQFRFASDISSYVEWTLEHCARSKLFTLQENINEGGRLPWAGWRSTRYEKKAIREGRLSRYLTYSVNDLPS